LAYRRGYLSSAGDINQAFKGRNLVLLNLVEYGLYFVAIGLFVSIQRAYFDQRMPILVRSHKLFENVARETVEKPVGVCF
jgi:hypothetical protein